MATKAQRAKSESQRTGRGGRTSIKKPRKSEWSHDKGHARTKATYALEPSNGARPSRESTRGSANRIKGDAARNITQEAQRNAPQRVARSARARSAHVRGS